MQGRHCALEEASMVENEKAERGESRLRAVLRMAGICALAALGLTIIVVAICWFAGWQSASQISSGLSWAGGIAIAIGVLSTVGGWGVTRDFRTMYAQSASHQDISSRTQQAVRDSLRSYNLAIVTVVAGLLCIGVAAWI